MKLSVNDTTSAKALLESDQIYIPAYQRPYRWDGEKAKQLFSDVTEYLKSLNVDSLRLVNRNRAERVEYFTGATVTTLDSNAALEIIDGQQRTTTFYLVAFVKFLLSARMLRERVDASEARALDVLQEALDARDLVFTKLDDFDHLLELKAKVDEAEIEFEEFLKESKNLINLLTRESISQCNWTLKLKYARDRINQDLTEALCRSTELQVTDTGFCLSVADTAKFPTESYQTTLESCLEWLNKELGEQTSIAAMLKKADTLLSNLLDIACVCNIRAENQNDAYTLFEILNDRSAPLKDLEIAKNLFYRFALQRGDNDHADQQLDEAEDLWSSAFENGNIEDVVYLAGTMLLTRNYELDFKKGQLADLRKSISSRLENQASYCVADVVADFKNYNEIGAFLDDHYVHQKRTQALIIEIFNDSREVSRIALMYFFALKQNKVVALLSVILQKENDDQIKKEISLAALRFSIKSLGSIEILVHLKNIASVLDRGENSAVKAQVAVFREAIEAATDIPTAFSAWSYTKSSHVTVLKTAISLYAATNGGHLGYAHYDLRRLPNWNNPNEFDLDHIVPKSKYDEVVEVSVGRLNEGSKANSLGNMMLLGNNTNRRDKLDSISFLLGEPNKPSDTLCRYTHIPDSPETNKYIAGIRDVIASHNIGTANEKISESLADDVRDFNISIIEKVISYS